MIPTVENILRMLKAGECTHEQALGWMEQHLSMRSEIAPTGDANPDLTAEEMKELQPAVIKLLIEAGEQYPCHDESEFLNQVDCLFAMARRALSTSSAGGAITPNLRQTVKDLLIDIESNAAIGEPDWDGISRRIRETMLALSLPSATGPSYADIAGAVARGWCSPNNAHKVMDTELAFAIAAQVAALIAPDR